MTLPATRWRAVELVGGLAILLGLARVCALFWRHGYLGEPFGYDVGDTYMDWFNTAWWGRNGHAYDVWRTIYPPFAFVITNLVGSAGCHAHTPFATRDCDVAGPILLLLLYASSVVVAGASLWRLDRTTALPRTIAIGLGGPLLYALERGQLLLLGFIAFALLYGGLVRSHGRFAGVAALMANTKIYLALPLVALAVKRDWRRLELCVFAALALYLASVIVIGAGTPWELAGNLQNWFAARQGAVWDELRYSTIYAPLLQLDAAPYPVRAYVDPQLVDIGLAFAQVTVLLSRLIAWTCIALAWVYPGAISTNRLVFFLLMQSFIAQNPGGYAITLIVFLVFTEQARNSATALALACAYLVSIPGDWTLSTVFSLPREAWLSGRSVAAPYDLAWGALIRPGLIALMLWALAADTLATIGRTARTTAPSWGLAKRGPALQQLAPA